MTRPAVTASLLLLLLVLAACSQRTEICSRPDQHPNCEAILEQRLAEARVPGVSVAILENRRLVSQWSAGHHAAENGRPLSSVTPFQAADLSEIVTALGVLVWVQQSERELEHTVNDSLSGWKIPDNSRWSGDAVTLRHLLSHRSGMTPTRFQGYRFGERQPGWEGLLNGIEPANSEAFRLAGEPGQTCHPSAASYEVLAYWLEQIGRAHV